LPGELGQWHRNYAYATENINAKLILGQIVVDPRECSPTSL